MDKITYINKFLSEKPYIPPYSNFATSLIYALSPQQASQMLDLSFNQDPSVRRTILKKILCDIKIKYLPIHKKLVLNLLKKLSIPSFPKRSSCAFSIVYLYPYLPKREQKSILLLLLSSKYLSIRERGLKILYQNWNTEYIDTIWNLWQKTYSSSCAKIMLENFPLEFLIKHFYSLLPKLPPWQQRKLFGRVVEKDKTIITQLKKADPITYAYFLVKQGKKLSSAQAWKITQAYYNSPKIELLLWCLGKMGLWKVLLRFQKEYLDKLPQYQIPSF